METNRNSCRILAALVLMAGFAAFGKDTGNAYVQPREGHFERMMFNNPGLEVDLSLGIWPHVSVYDYDRDGKNDVVVCEGDAGDVLCGPWGGHAAMFRNSRLVHLCGYLWCGIMRG